MSLVQEYFLNKKVKVKKVSIHYMSLVQLKWCDIDFLNYAMFQYIICRWFNIKSVADKKILLPFQYIICRWFKRC